MSDMEALVTATWDHRQDHQSSEHKAVLAELAHRGNSLSREERGWAVSYLKWAVLDGAQEAGAYTAETVADGNGHSFLQRNVDERRFPEEIAWIKRLTADKRFSSHLEGWLARKRHAFVDEFRRDPRLMAGMEQWPRMTPNERKEFLAVVVRRRIESFSDEKHPFAMPEIDISTDAMNGCGGGASASRNQIRFNKVILEADDPSTPLMWIYHEGTHNILTQLTMAAEQGEIAEQDPLYGDIQKLLFFRKNGLSPPAEIVSWYAADDEERLAFQEQEFFLSNLLIGHGLRAKFDVARFAMSQYWRQDSQKFGLRAVLHDLRFG
jgi:hypothetical protein